MMGFDLAENPFVRLGLSPLDGRERLNSAVDSALWDDDSPEHEHKLNLARNDLVAPKTRLDAELGFFLGLGEFDYAPVLKALKTDTAAPEMDSLQGLDRANLLAHRCSAAGPIDTRIRRCNALVRAHADVSVRNVASDIAKARRAAQMAPVSDEDLRAGLQRLRRRHADVLVEALVSDSQGVSLIGDWAARLSNEPGRDAELIESVLSAYEAAVATKLETAASAVRQELANLADGDGDDLSEFESRLREWDRLAQPLQLAGNARGIDEQHSKDLFTDIRNTMLELAREKSLHETVLAATVIAAEVFAELPDAAQTLHADREILESIVSRAQILGPLSAAIEDAKDNIDRFRSQLAFGCGARAGPMVKSVFLHLTNAMEADDPDVIDEAVGAVRGLALLIHNEHDDREGALAITEALLRHRRQFSAHCAETLDEDAATLSRNIKMTALTTALQSGHLDQADALADELLEGAVGDRANTLHGLKSTIAARRQAKRDKYIGWGVLGAVILGVGAFNSAVQSKKPPSYEGSGQSAYGDVARDPSFGGIPNPKPIGPPSLAPTPDAAANTLAEQMPSPYTTGALSLYELMYCQAQKVRIEAAERAVASSPQVKRFNAEVDDFNARCGRYQYRQEDMDRVLAEVSAARTRLQSEGRALVGKAAPPPPLVEPAYENFGADPAPAEGDEANDNAN